MNSSEYLNAQRREYSLYVLQSRAIPHIADGLKTGARRLIWTARDGLKSKCATLAGAAMAIHPHASMDDTIGTIAATYGNNIPLIKGKGAFGTLLKPTAYGASRYTSVSLSQFTKDVIFKDIDIVPMIDNYDGTLKEPQHFLPLVPVVLLNYQEGIAVGFACKILPRNLNDIIKDQIRYLSGNQHLINSPLPQFTPTNQQATRVEGNGSTSKWFFEGTFTKINATTIKITNLPQGIIHEKFIEKLINLEYSKDSIIQEVEDNSSDTYDIDVRFKKGTLRKMTDDDIVTFLNLKSTITENLNVIGVDGKSVTPSSYNEIIETFTKWRLSFYVKRYTRLVRLLENDIQKYKDVVLAIYKKINTIASKTSSRKELKLLLKSIGIVNIDYIADLSIYRFTQEEKEKTELKIKNTNVILNQYKTLILSKDERVKQYISELQLISSKFKKGNYT